MRMAKAFNSSGRYLPAPLESETSWLKNFLERCVKIANGEGEDGRILIWEPALSER